MSFAENLTKARLNIGLSRKEMAAKLGISLPAYSNYENGAREPKFSILKEISYILKVSTDKLLDIDESVLNDYFYKTGVNLMIYMGYSLIDNPFDIHNYAEFNLYFSKNNNDLATIIAFKKSYFIELMKSAENIYPDHDINTSRHMLLLNYANSFLLCEGPYNEWLDDLQQVIDKTKKDYSFVYHNNAIRAGKEYFGENNIMHTLNRRDCDLKIKAYADLRELKELFSSGSTEKDIEKFLSQIDDSCFSDS